ncbi:MAG: 4'-phosphopantetheinyl transferase superfamily protein [Proteobacteria bacterium]|nr:4'-phosphopantetheinyl transferase superfamily protein [Pseudomonadota bacterium]
MDSTVTLWTLNIDASPIDWKLAASLLDADERQRAQRFVFDRDRRRFIGRRAALRQIIAHHAGTAANDIEFRYGPYGRPSVAGLPFDFNLSHSHGFLLVAVACETRIGVDVERRQDEAIDPAVLQPYLAPAAFRQLCAESPQRRQQAFYAWWTRIEALAKARGTGIAVTPATQLDGSADDLLARALPDAEGQLHTWYPRPLEVSPLHAATLVLSAPGRAVHIKTWSPALSH